jgi:hypothetical protein
MQGPGLSPALLAGLKNTTAKPWVVYLPPPLTEDDEASIPMMEDDEASIVMVEDNEASNLMEDDGASLLTKHVRNGPHLSAGTRKVAKRTFPWDLTPNETDTALLPLQNEEARATKRPRLEIPFPVSINGATTDYTSRVTTTVALSFPNAAGTADTHPVMDTHPHTSTTGASRHWIPAEDAKLTRAVAKTRKKKYGKKSITNWAAIATLVPDRTQVQCRKRWHETLLFNINRKTADVSTQGPSNPTEDEEASIPTPHLSAGTHKVTKRTFPLDLTLNEIEAAVPLPQDEYIHKTKRPRLERSFSTSTSEATPVFNTSHATTLALHPTGANDATDHVDTDLMVGIHPNSRSIRTRHHWTREEDTKLTGAVTNTRKKKCGKRKNMNWAAIAALVPDRTEGQCSSRWYGTLNANINLTTSRTPRRQWTVKEDKRLKHAVSTYGGKNWKAIAVLVSSRTKKQCSSRWLDILDARVDQTPRRNGKWTEDEDVMLEDAVLMHGDKNWKAIVPCVPGRNKKQCLGRWRFALDTRGDRTPRRTGKWMEDEDRNLRDAVRTLGDKNWDAIAHLVPGRTMAQCLGRWRRSDDGSVFG